MRFIATISRSSPQLVALPTWPADMPASESAERDFAFIRDGLLRALSPMALRNAPSKGQGERHSRQRALGGIVQRARVDGGVPLLADDRASDAVDTEDGGSGVSRGGAGVEGSPGPRGGAAGPRGDGQISQAFEVFQDSRDATSSGQRLSLAAPRRRSNDGVSHTSSFPRYGGGDQVPGVSFASLRWSVQVAQWYDADAVARAYGVEGGTDRAGARAGRVTREVTLEQCLEAFSQHETLEPEDMWFCPKCKEFVQARRGVQTLDVLAKEARCVARRGWRDRGGLFPCPGGQEDGFVAAPRRAGGALEALLLHGLQPGQARHPHALSHRPAPRHEPLCPRTGLAADAV